MEICCLQLSWKLLTGVVSLCNSCEYWHDGPRGDTILPLKRKSVHMGVVIHVHIPPLKRKCAHFASNVGVEVVKLEMMWVLLMVLEMM